MKKQWKILAAGTALLLLAIAFAAIYAAARPAVSEGGKTISVEVVHSDGSANTFTVETGEAYLGQALLNEGLIQGEESAYGLYVTEADGEAAVYEDNGSYWALYQNDAYANQGVSETPVVDGDSYALVYTIG